MSQFRSDVVVVVGALVGARDGVGSDGSVGGGVSRSVLVQVVVGPGVEVEPKHRSRVARVVGRLTGRRLATETDGVVTAVDGLTADEIVDRALVDPSARIPDATPEQVADARAAGALVPAGGRPSAAAVLDDEMDRTWRTYIEYRDRATPEEREELRSYLCVHGVRHWRYWLPEMFPAYFTAPFAPYHADLWDWITSLSANEPATPFVGVWARGAAKSTNVEAAVVALAALDPPIVNYCVYVSGTQDLADQHVENIGSMLESNSIGRYHPALGDRAVSKFGKTRAWRRNRLVTASGLVVDALGLEGSLRGIRFEEQRPNLIVLDDIDDEQDGPAHVKRKIDLITKKILPAGDNTSPGGTKVVAVQNLIHPDSVFASLVSTGGPSEAEPATFLRPRIVSGPIKAVDGLEVEETPDGYEIVGGTPTWPEGMGLDACQRFIEQWGLSAFMSEAQHEEPDLTGGMFTHVPFGRYRIGPDELPDAFLDTVAVVDPAVSKTDRSDACGLQIDARGADGLIYRLHSWEQRATPLEAIQLALRWAVHWGAETLVVETDQGGDTWESVYREALAAVEKEGIFDRPDCPVPTRRRPGPRPSDPGRRREIPRVPKLRPEKAGSTGASKQERAARMMIPYDLGTFRHLAGATRPLERGLRRFPRYKPYDLVDAAYWGWHVLEELSGRSPRQRFSVRRPTHRARAYRPLAPGMN